MLENALIMAGGGGAGQRSSANIRTRCSIMAGKEAMQHDESHLK